MTRRDAPSAHLDAKQCSSLSQAPLALHLSLCISRHFCLCISLLYFSFAIVSLFVSLACMSCYVSLRVSLRVYLPRSQERARTSTYIRRRTYLLCALYSVCTHKSDVPIISRCRYMFLCMPLPFSRCVPRHAPGHFDCFFSVVRCSVLQYVASSCSIL